MRHVLAAACMLALCASGAAAQHVVPGDTIRAHTFEGATWTGVLLHATSARMQLARTGAVGIDTLQLADIRSLSVRRDATQLSRAFEGGVVGLLGVLATGLVLGTIICHDEPTGYASCGFGAAVYTAAAVPFGIGIGAAMGSKYGERRKWVRVQVQTVRPD